MRRLPLLLMAAIVLGCSGDSAPLTLAPTDANVAGSFALNSANGQPLPLVALLSTEEEWDMIADQMDIAADNTWTETSTFTIYSRADGSSRGTSTAVSGTYAVVSNVINFTITTNGTGTFTGSVTGNTLNTLYNGKHFLYLR